MDKQIDLDNEPVYRYKSNKTKETFRSMHTLKEFRDCLIERIKKKIAEADPEKIEYILLTTVDGYAWKRYQVEIQNNSIKTEGLLSPSYIEIEKKDYKIPRLKKYKTAIHGIEDEKELEEIETAFFGTKNKGLF